MIFFQPESVTREQKKIYPFFSLEEKFPTNPPLTVALIMTKWKYAVEDFICVIAVVSGSFLPVSQLPNTTEFTELPSALLGLFRDAFMKLPLARLHGVARGMIDECFSKGPRQFCSLCIYTSTHRSSFSALSKCTMFRKR